MVAATARWITPVDLPAYVQSTLSREAAELRVTVDRSYWVMENLLLDQLHVDAALIDRHDQDSMHLERRDRFIAAIQADVALLPLIAIWANMTATDSGGRYLMSTEAALGGSLFLVDGYARYRALRLLGEKAAQVIVPLARRC